MLIYVVLTPFYSLGEEKVVLKRKHIKKIPPDTFNVESIKSFNMSYNMISSIPPQISQLYNLTELNLSHNCLTNKGVPPFTALTSLCSLDLSNNLLISLPDILTCTSLRTLNLSYNGYGAHHHITYTTPHHISPPCTSGFTSFQQHLLENDLSRRDTEHL